MSVKYSRWFNRYADHGPHQVTAAAIQIDGEDHYLTTDFGKAIAFDVAKGQEIVRALNSMSELRPRRRKRFLTASQALVFMLMLDAALVAGILISGRTAWPWICLYWVLLTVKNLIDWAAPRRR